uniref:Uncharacterized protein n=1 Tax=Hyaloperonospora arabidopsidis (strain Emoy2) TaxID=559515 RepID=M4BRK0_HYAAE
MESNTPPRAFNRAPTAPSLSRYDRRAPSAMNDPDTSRQTQLQSPVPSGPPARTPKGGVSHSWQPGRGGGRHNSPLYGKQRKRPSSIDSNVSWSGSEIDSMGAFGAVHGNQEQVPRLSWASSVRDDVPATEQMNVTATAASLFGSSAVALPRAAAAEREQMGGSGNGSGVQSLNEVPGQQLKSRAGSRTTSSEHVHVTPPPSSSSSVYDEEKNGPQSCPSTFVNTRAPHFSIDKLRQLRSTELVASTLLPTRASVDSLMGYVRELQLSEATLRKQLEKTKQHTEKELSLSLSKVGELERNMQEVERDRELARRKLQEQERLIRDLADKLKQAEAAKSARSNVDELSSIAEEASLPSENEVATVSAAQKQVDTAVVTASTPAASMQHLMQHKKSSSTLVHLDQTNENNRSAQHELASPRRSPERSLWDPWVSEGVTSVKNHPPVFTIGSTELDPVVSSSSALAQTLMTNSETAADRLYELKSVLQSPRQEQEQIGAVQNDVSPQRRETGAIAVPLGVQQEHAQQYIPAISNVTSMPSPMYSSSSQHDFVSTGAQNAAYHVQSENKFHADFPSQAIPVTSTDPMYSSNDELWEQRDDVNISAGGYTTNTGDSEIGTLQGQLKGRLSTSSVPPSKRAGGEISDDLVLPGSVHPAEISTVMSLSQRPVEQPQFPLEPSTGTSVGTKVTGQEQGSKIGAENSFSTSSIPPSSVSPRPPFSTHESEAYCTTSSIQDDSSAAPIESVSLETLLVDFFAEVDNSRLKMAKVYGKRYAGREKWLFAELTKRYGAAKVAALKARFDTGSGGDVFAEANRADGPEAQHATKSSDAPNYAEPGRRGSLERPHVFHPPTPTSRAKFDAGTDTPSVPSPVAGLQVRGESRPQSRQVVAEVGTFPIPGESVSASPASSQQRHSGGDMPSLSGPHTSFPSPLETGEELNAASVCATGASSFKRGPFPMTQRGEPFKHRSFPPQTGTESDDASLGLRQRRQTSTCSQDDAAVTLESLLEELYKNHQPDKLKNVSTVAKQGSTVP